MSDFSLTLNSLCKTYTTPALSWRRKSGTTAVKKHFPVYRSRLAPGCMAFWGQTVQANPH